MKAFADLVHAMLPFAELLASDEFTARERVALRQLCGGSSIFELSTNLNRLCSETARAHSLW
jgi:hypothetical protein